MAAMSSALLSSPGFFGPVTATLDWCEANYQFSHYIAEMANTLSNLFTIYLSIHGALGAAREALPDRYVFGFIGVGLVGLGSFAFHATLLFEAQLADELPMIFVGSLSLWHLFDCQPGFGLHSVRAKSNLAILIIFNTLFTWSYYVYRNPVYHQVVFAFLVIATTLRVTYLLKWSETRTRIPDDQKAVIGKIFASGAATFALGFFIWNLDNIFCGTLTSFKARVGWPLAFLLEGHSWWHILTGAGTYLMSIGIEYVTLCIKDDYRKYTIGYTHGLPHVKRVPKELQ